METEWTELNLIGSCEHRAYAESVLNLYRKFRFVHIHCGPLVEKDNTKLKFGYFLHFIF